MIRITLSSMLNTMNRHNPTSWVYHLFWSELVSPRSSNSSNRMTLLVNALLLGNCLKEKDVMCLNYLVLFSCVLMLESNLDKNGVLNFFSLSLFL